jgi:tetratricopeptide (TPR) repeat protein
MKKIILFLVLVMSFTFTYAQKSNVRLAKDKALSDGRPDFKGARDAIKLALQDSTTKNQAETWYVAGLIGNKQSEKEFNKAVLNYKYDTITKGKAVVESYDYFVQAAKLDMMPDPKGKVKPKFVNEIKPIIKDYYTSPHHLTGYGVYQYYAKDYNGAVKTFESILEIPNLPFMNNEIKIDSMYYKIMYFAGVCASSAKMHDKALKYFESLRETKYNPLGVYRSLSDEYLIGKDTVNYLKTIKFAVDKFPSQSWYLQNLINFYIHANKTKDALTYLNAAIEREPSNSEYHFIKGQLYLSIDNFDEAYKALTKASEIDPKNPDVFAETGRSFYNKAVKMSLEANKIKDLNLAKKEEVKVVEIFKQAIPMYKKALELKPNNLDYMTPLKQLYYRLQMDSDYDVINKKIKELQK